jgi:hypothetical protein
MAHPILRQRAAQFVAWCLSKTVSRAQEPSRDPRQEPGALERFQDRRSEAERHRETVTRHYHGGRYGR